MYVKLLNANTLNMQKNFENWFVFWSYFSHANIRWFQVPKCGDCFLFSNTSSYLNNSIGRLITAPKTTYSISLFQSKRLHTAKQNFITLCHSLVKFSKPLGLS